MTGSLLHHRRLRRLLLPGRHHFRLTHYTNHYALELWFFSMRLSFKVEWSGHKTTHLWRIRQWGWREWIGNCVYRFKHGDGSFENPGPDRGEVIVAHVALALGWTAE